jgi:threonine dehydrogenase-like Zn-dependent dehydrogenase
VVGAGLIGLLVISILSQLHLTTLRAVDPLPTRRALARLVGATEARDPAALGGQGGEEEEQADTSIEVSGVAAGLQTALDHTGYGGRVVVGSWYGNHEKPATLRLGLPFHRSHLRVQCSQVSRISTELQDRWSKARRFGVAWELLRRLRPSRTLTTLVVAPERVGEAFEALDTRAVETLAVLIDYRRQGEGQERGGMGMGK